MIRPMNAVMNRLGMLMKRPAIRMALAVVAIGIMMGLLPSLVRSGWHRVRPAPVPTPVETGSRFLREVPVDLYRQPDEKP